MRPDARDPSAPELPTENLSPETADFLGQARHVSSDFDVEEPLQVLLLLDARREQAVLDALERRGIIDSRLARRIDYVLGTVSDGEQFRLWVGGNFPRFRSAVALSSRGWRRSRPGVWHDGEYTEVTLHRGGILEIAMTPPTGTFTILTGGDTLPGRTEGRNPATMASLFSRIENQPVGIAFLGTTPEIGLGALQPESVLMQLDATGSLVMDLQFSGEREGRVMLVGIRLGSHRILETLRLSTGDAFAITRTGSIVRIEDLVVSDADVDRFVGAILGGEASREEEHVR